MTTYDRTKPRVVQCSECGQEFTQGVYQKRRLTCSIECRKAREERLRKEGQP